MPPPHGFMPPCNLPWHTKSLVWLHAVRCQALATCAARHVPCAMRTGHVLLQRYNPFSSAPLNPCHAGHHSQRHGQWLYSPLQPCIGPSPQAMLSQGFYHPCKPHCSTLPRRTSLPATWPVVFFQPPATLHCPILTANGIPLQSAPLNPCHVGHHSQRPGQRGDDMHLPGAAQAGRRVHHGTFTAAAVQAAEPAHAARQ